MKLIYTFLGLLLCFYVNAQSNHILKASVDKFITVQFPSKVEYFQNSVSIDEKIGIKQVDDILFIQFVENNVPETNLFVKTLDNKTYTFLLQYEDNPEILNYSIGLDQNVLHTPKINANEEQASKSNNLNNLSVNDRILKENGYIKNRNISVYKNVKIILKGVYVNEGRIYFLMRLENNSNILYDVNSYKFYITNDKGISSSEQTIDLPVISITPNKKTLPKGKNDMVFMFDKFTVGKDKQLLFELTEKNGDRNLSFKIQSILIDNARIFK